MTQEKEHQNEQKPRQNTGSEVYSDDADLLRKSEIEALTAQLHVRNGEDAAPPAPAPGESRTQDLDYDPEATKESVGGENLAAATAEDLDNDLLPQDLLDSLVEEAQGAAPTESAAKNSAGSPEALRSAADAARRLGIAEAPGDPSSRRPAPKPRAKKRAWRLRVPGSALLRGVRWGRFAGSLIVGTIVGALFYYHLSQNMGKPPGTDDLLAVERNNLYHALQTGRGLVEKERYQEAIALLRPAIEQEPESVMRTDAEALVLTAELRRLPARPDPITLDALHSRIDVFVESAPNHSQALEFVRWKARLYELGGIPRAAQEVYKTALEQYRESENRAALLYDVARNALDLDQAEEARLQLEDLLNQFPAAPEAGDAKLLLADALVELDRTAEAQGILSQIAALQPNTVLGARAVVRLSRLYLEAGDYQSAIDELNRRLTTATTVQGNDKVYLMLARAYRAADRFAEAERVLRELLDFFPPSETTPEAMIELGDILDLRGKREQAVHLYRAVARQYANQPRTLLKAGDRLASCGDAYGASHAYLKADASGADDPQVLLKAAEQLAAIDDLQQAAAVLRDLLERHPTTPEAVDASLASARIAYEQGHVRDALSRLEELALTTEGLPQEGSVLTTLGEMYSSLGLKERAAAVYGKTAKLASNPDVLARTAYTLFDAGSAEEAMELAGRVELAQASAPEAYALLVMQGEYLLQKSLADAVEKLEQASRDYPELRTVHGDDLLIRAYLARDDRAKARIVLMELDQRAAKDPSQVPGLQHAANHYGDYLYEKGDYREAANVYALAVKPGYGADAETDWAKYKRANALLQIGNYEDSLTLFEEVARSESEWASEAKLKAQRVRLALQERGHLLPVDGPQDS